MVFIYSSINIFFYISDFFIIILYYYIIGAQYYYESKPIPAGAITVEDAELLGYIQVKYILNIYIYISIYLYLYLYLYIYIFDPYIQKVKYGFLDFYSFFFFFFFFFFKIRMN